MPQGLTVSFNRNYNVLMRYLFKPNLLKMFIDEQFAGRSLSDLLVYYGQSSSAIYKLLLHKQILIDHVPVTDRSYLLETGMELDLIIPDEEVDFVPAARECTVVYEDEWQVAVKVDGGKMV